MNIPSLNSNTIKETFDSLRNVGISAAIFYAGYTVLKIPATKLENPTFAHTVGAGLVALSILLLALCVLYFYEKIKAAPNLNKAIAVSLSLVFSAIICMIFLTIPMSHGLIY
ncbi:hypothetical protein ACYZUD_04250 [Pseudomonas sp. XS1P51]